MTSSPEPPVALIGDSGSPSPETPTAEQCNKWHHATRPRAPAPQDPFARTIYHNVPTPPRGLSELRHDIVMGGPLDNSSRACCAIGNRLPGRLLVRH